MNQLQNGHKLRDLTAFLTQTLGNKIAKRLSSEMGDIELLINPKFQGTGYDMMVMRYDAEIYVDRFPFNEYDPAVLLANVAAWLMDNDTDRDRFEALSDPQVDITIEDETSAEVIINLFFEEDVKVVEDPKGKIIWRGKTWAIAPYVVNTATRLIDVTHD